MPAIVSRFRPPLLFRNGHAQTILGAIRPRRITLASARERLELADEDFLDLDWARVGHGRVAILSPGLEGASTDPVCRGLAAALNAAGWDALAWNFRGCSGEPNRLLRFYHSGETRDLAAVIARAAAHYRSVALVGFSLGGNMTLKYLGEAAAHPAVIGAVAISAPIDLGASSRALDRRLANRLYLRRFMKSLTAKVAAKAVHFPADLDTKGLRHVGSFAEFDDRYTARIHGFRDAADYWARSSARQYLHGISVPTLLINALDDPFLTKESFPFLEAEAHRNFFLETPANGGHLGFLDIQGSWVERRIPEFLATISASA